MSVVLAHRQALAALIGAVPMAGLVHDHEPYAAQEAAFRTKYLWTLPSGARQVRGWFIRRTGTRETELGVARVLNMHTWQVRGFMALDDAADTEIEFDELIEAIRKAYRADPTLGGAADLSPADGAGINVTDSRPVVFCGVLCHSAVLTLTTHAYLSAGE